MASLVDNLRDKWEAITPRERKIVVFGGIAAILTIVLWLAFSIRDGLHAIEHRNARMESALDTLSELRVRGQQKPAGDDIVSTIGTEGVRLETYLSKAAESVKITVPSFNPRTPVEKNGFRTKSTSLELRDLSIDQVKDYLEAIETGNKLVQVTALTVNRNFRDKEKIDLKLEVSTYEKIVEQPAAGSGSGSGSGTASGSASGGGG
jgi:type II secretory pathway component PulM